MAVFVVAQPSAWADNAMLELATERGCFICHSMQKASSGVPLAPSYEEVAERYKGSESALDYHTGRIITGSVDATQNWAGKANMRFMPPNVNMSEAEAGKLVKWILHIEDKVADEKLLRHEKLLALATYSGCMICHATEVNPDHRYIPLAPAFKAVAARYAGKADSRASVLDSVVLGTQKKEQHWESVNMQFMPPNVALKAPDAEQLVDWILSM